MENINVQFKKNKLCLSPIKEAQWLNSMAQEGMYLESRSVLTYKFSNIDTRPRKTVYSVRFFDTPPSSDVSKKYIDKRIQNGSVLVCTYSNYAYFLTPTDDVETLADDAKQNRSHIGNFLFLYAGILLLWLGLMCYNIVQWVRFVAAEYTKVNLDDFIHDFTFDLSGIFGDYKTTSYISLYLMLAIIFIPISVYYFDAYMGARKYEKELMSQANEQ